MSQTFVFPHFVCFFILRSDYFFIIVNKACFFKIRVSIRYLYGIFTIFLFDIKQKSLFKVNLWWVKAKKRRRTTFGVPLSHQDKNIQQITTQLKLHKMNVEWYSSILVNKQTQSMVWSRNINSDHHHCRCVCRWYVRRRKVGEKQTKIKNNRNANYNLETL